MDTFGDRLRKLRIDRNKLQKEIAIDLDISYTGYSSYENNLRMPGIKMLMKIADYYNVSIDYLLGRNLKNHIDNNKLDNELEQIKKQIVLIQKYINSK